MALSSVPQSSSAQTKPFHLLETSVEDVHNAYKSGKLTAHQLVQMYLDRIKAYDQQGPKINADRLDAALKTSGLVGPLHGIPVLLKDQVDVAGLPTTLGSDLRAERLQA